MAVELKSNGCFIGWAGIKIEHNVNGHESFVDLGYRFLPEHWDNGYATEASSALLTFGFDILKLDKICAYAETG